MASNFVIFAHRNSESLHLRIIGDFDGTSACEVFNFIKDNSHAVKKVFVHTGLVKKIYPFGRDTFQKKMGDLTRHSIRISFTGTKASQIAPEGTRCA
jgi:hypothetical protein